MSLLGVPEVAALSWNPLQNKVCGVRLKSGSRGGFELLKYAQSNHSDWQRAADEVLKALGVNSSVYVVLALVLENSEVFECSLPAAAPEVMREALRFEVPRQIMSVPEDFRLQYVPLGEPGEDGMVKVRCCVFPESSLHKISNQIAPLRNRPDAVVNPLLTIPSDLPAGAAVMLDGFEVDYCWCGGFWQQLAGQEELVNKDLDAFCCRLCNKAQDIEKFPGEYRTATVAALFGMRKLFTRNNVLGGVTILPDFLRPARYRTQLRVMALLLVLLIGVNVFRYAGGFLSEYREYRKLAAKVTNQRSKVQELKRKVKSAERQQKELQRTAELKLGSRECLGYLGYLSEKLPDEVLLSNFRWNEGTMDLNLQTTSGELDLVSFFNRLPGFKVLSASQRTNPVNSFTNANVKLSIIEVAEKAVRSKSKAKGKTKK